MMRPRGHTPNTKPSECHHNAATSSAKLANGRVHTKTQNRRVKSFTNSRDTDLLKNVEQVDHDDQDAMHLEHRKTMNQVKSTRFTLKRDDQNGD